MQYEKYKNFIKEIDFTGPSPMFYTNSQSSFKTFFGGILSIITFILMLAIGLYFTILTVTRANYSILYNEIVNKDNYLNLNEDNPLIIGMFSKAGNPLTSDYLSFKATYHSLIGLNLTVTKIDMFPCTDDLISSKFRSMVPEKYQPLMPFFWCIHPSDYNNRPLFGVHGQPTEMGFFMIHTILCRNGTSDVICSNQTAIDHETQSSFLTFAFKDHQMDHSSVDTPGKPYFKSFSFGMNPSLFYKYIFRYRNIDYSSDLNLLLSSSTVKHYFTMEDNFLNVISLTEDVIYPGTIGTSLVSLSEKKPTYLRIYEKIQDLLANLGGVMKAILIVNSILQKVFLDKLFSEYLINYLYSFDSNGNNDETKKLVEFNNVVPQSVRRYSRTLNEIQRMEHSSLRNINEYKEQEPMYVFI
jgi:hypothetical protein